MKSGSLTVAQAQERLGGTNAGARGLDAGGAGGLGFEDVEGDGGGGLAVDADVEGEVAGALEVEAVDLGWGG